MFNSVQLLNKFFIVKDFKLHNRLSNFIIRLIYWLNSNCNSKIETLKSIQNIDLGLLDRSSFQLRPSSTCTMSLCNSIYLNH